MKLPTFCLGELCFKMPVIQGGMGVGISCSKLASAVSAAGGLGVISSAEIGYAEPDFREAPLEANLRALRKEIQRAKALSGNAPIGINIMVAMRHYAEVVRVAVEEKIDVIISGAGLPLNLPKLVGDSDVKLIPIVSSARAAKVLMAAWDRNYKRRADAIVVEGPRAGGHLGFSKEDLSTGHAQRLEEIVSEIKAQWGESMPIIAAGGVFDGADAAKQFAAGASAVQMATRFVPTFECDAHPDYKQAYIDATPEDIVLVHSPVGLPGRALNNAFVKKIGAGEPLSDCHQCLMKCDHSYCISDALIEAVKGNVNEGLIFVGENAHKCKGMTSVKAVMREFEEEVAKAML
ncbi:MAG: nitronate monooxygenase [Clostridiales bacterium]|nr:nitronate monooxygenase [Clostridiales bacterium]